MDNLTIDEARRSVAGAEKETRSAIYLVLETDGMDRALALRNLGFACKYEEVKRHELEKLERGWVPATGKPALGPCRHCGNDTGCYCYGDGCSGATEHEDGAES